MLSKMFDIIRGTNVAPIIVNINVAMLENELRRKCMNDPKLKWPILLIRFNEDGFGVKEGFKFPVEYWIEQFNSSRKSIKTHKWSFWNKS